MGESKSLRFTLSVEDLKFYDKDMISIAEPVDFKIFIGTNLQEVKEALFRLQ